VWSLRHRKREGEVREVAQSLIALKKKVATQRTFPFANFKKMTPVAMALVPMVTVSERRRKRRVGGGRRFSESQLKTLLW